MLSSRTWRTSPSHPRAAGRSTSASTPGPCRTTDSISPDHYSLEQDAIFRKTWLNVGRVEQLPRKGSYFTKELDAANTSVVLVRDMEDEVRAFHNMCRHRGNKLVWNDYPRRGDQRGLPPVHLQVPRVALRPRGPAHLHPAGGRVLRRGQGRLRPGARQRRRLGGVHLRELRSRRGAVEGLPGPAGVGHRGLPVPPHDAEAHVPGGDRRQLEAVHRRLHGVLPRTRSAREAVGGRGVPQAAGLRLRGPGVRRGRRSLAGLVVGRHVPAQGPQHGQAHRAGPAQRPVRRLGRPRHRRAARGPQPRPAPGVGRGLVPLLPQLHAADLEAELVPHVPLLADLVQHPHLRVRRSTSCPRRTPTSGCSRSWPSSPSRSTASRTATPWRRRRRCSSRAPSPSSRSATRRCCSGTSTPPPAATWPSTSAGQSATAVRISAAS